MEIFVRRTPFKFEWDSEKSEANLEKHGVTFLDATEVFFDPLVQFLSAEPVDTEDRSIAIGRNISLNILLVVHTERDDHIRIVSARPPTRHERRLYEA